jgi:geranylgeranyl pyrophosphate synthase/predicted secreted hydrolase
MTQATQNFPETESQVVYDGERMADGATTERRESDVRRVRPTLVKTDGRRRPRDWPDSGPIDLGVHDLPHASSTTEWWYQNTHLVGDDGRHYSLFAAFFRQAKGRDATSKRFLYAHSVTWAIACVEDESYVHHSGVDQSAPEEGLRRIRRGIGSKDSRLNRALAEMLERGQVPGPDRIFEGRVFVSMERLDLDYSGDSFKKLDDGSYLLKLDSSRERAGCELTFVPKKPPTRHGDDGVVKGGDDEDMFYYFIPRCDVTGTLVYNGVELSVVEGSGWCDHEFGVGELLDEDLRDEPEEKKKERRRLKEERAVGWDWLSVQLDDGSELSVYPEVYVTRNEAACTWAILIDAEGRRHAYDQFTMDPVEFWQSTQTFFEYPVRYRLAIPQAEIELDVRAAFHDQEFITLISKPSFWEGRVEVEGTIAGKAVRGPGFIERSGFTPFDDLDGYFEAVGKVVRRSVARALPLENLDYETAKQLVASEGRDQYLDGLDLEQLSRTLLKPIREITDRGGKGWRSYAAITCCDLVGGDSRKFVEWLAMPELMHVGSLIVDDVEDKSVVRRGGPTAHLLYGEAQAINSGTAAYFITQKMLVSSKHLSDADRLKIYDLYFEAMRAGHAGQAVDLDGFDHILGSVVESGDGADLERRVLAVHRLKTAAPAGCLARMGAIAGGGSKAQVEALGNFFESLGLAFQIIDDVLNLRGFKNDLKSKGEDVAQGKITLPVAKAMSRLDGGKRAWLWETLRSKPQDPAVIGEVIDVLEQSGSIETCDREAHDLIETGWKHLDPLVDDTLAKMMLRAFGWFVLERHY